MDTTRVGEVAATLMELIAEAYGDDATVGVVAIVVEVDIPPSDPGEHGITEIQVRCSEPRRWIQAGLLESARACVLPDD